MGPIDPEAPRCWFAVNVHHRNRSSEVLVLMRSRPRVGGSREVAPEFAFLPQPKSVQKSKYSKLATSVLTHLTLHPRRPGSTRNTEHVAPKCRRMPTAPLPPIESHLRPTILGTPQAQEPEKKLLGASRASLRVRSGRTLLGASPDGTARFRVRTGPVRWVRWAPVRLNGSGPRAALVGPVRCSRGTRESREPW